MSDNTPYRCPTCGAQCDRVTIEPIADRENASLKKRLEIVDRFWCRDQDALRKQRAKAEELEQKIAKLKQKLIARDITIDTLKLKMMKAGFKLIDIETGEAE